jgi:hypothetical protein
MKRGIRGKTRRRRGGVIIGTGANGSAYSKPDEMETLLPEGCEWKDGYVMKVFETTKYRHAMKEWRKTEILREKNLQGMIYPETNCTLTDGRTAIFSPSGGQTVAEFFYSEGPIITNDDMKAMLANARDNKIVRNAEKVDEVVEALRRLIEQVKTMNDMEIYHNDIHDGNIVYDGKEARLIDFGEMSEEGDAEDDQIEGIINNLKPSGGLRKRAVASKRRTRRRRSFRSR